MSFNQGFNQGGFNGQPQQQFNGGYQQQGSQGGAQDVLTDQGTITKIYENQRQDGSVNFAIILDNDNNRRYSTKHRPQGEGTQVEIQYVAKQGQNGKVNRYVRKLNAIGGGQQQAPQQQGFNQPAAQGGFNPGQAAHAQSHQAPTHAAGGIDTRTKSIVRQTLIKSVAPALLQSGRSPQDVLAAAQELEQYALGLDVPAASNAPQQAQGQDNGGFGGGFNGGGFPQ